MRDPNALGRYYYNEHGKQDFNGNTIYRPWKNNSTKYIIPALLFCVVFGFFSIMMMDSYFNETPMNIKINGRRFDNMKEAVESDPGASLFFAFPFVSLGAFYIFLIFLLNRTQVSYQGNKLIISRGPLPVRNYKKVLRASSIRQVYVETYSKYRVNGTPIPQYKVILIVGSGKKVVIDQKLFHRESALFLEQWIEDKLGIKDMALKQENLELYTEATTFVEDAFPLVKNIGDTLKSNSSNYLDARAQTEDIKEDKKNSIDLTQKKFVRKWSSRNWGQILLYSIIVLVFGNGIFVFGTSSLSGEGINILAWTIGPMLLSIPGYFLVTLLFNKTKFSIEGEYLHVKRGPIFCLSSSNSFHKNELEQIYVDKYSISTFNDRNIYQYRVVAKLKDGSELYLDRGMGSAEIAKDIERWLEHSLNIKNKHVPFEVA